MHHRLIVFDVDGTLFDTKDGIYAALEDVFQQFDIGTFNRDEGLKYIGPPIRDSLVKYNGLSLEQAQKATEYYRYVYVDKYITLSKLYEGTRDLLEKLKNDGIRSSIATMKTSEQIGKLFDITDIDTDAFDCIETAQKNGNLSKREMISRIKNKCSINERIVMIGDTEGDREAADAAGVDFVGAVYGYGFTRVQRYGFPIVTSVKEILSAVNSVGMY